MIIKFISSPPIIIITDGVNMEDGHYLKVIRMLLPEVQIQQQHFHNECGGIAPSILGGAVVNSGRNTNCFKFVIVQSKLYLSLCWITSCYNYGHRGDMQIYVIDLSTDNFK